MKKMNILIISSMILGITIGACEFTITLDPEAGYNKVYISFNKNLADLVSEQTLKDSSFSEKEDDKIVVKKDFSINREGRKTTPFTQWFDVFVPLKSNGQFERRYRVKMNYCSKDNAMTISQIMHKKINMKRFKIINFHDENEANEAHMHCPAHTSKYLHQHEYEAKFEKNTQLSNPATTHLEEKVVHPYGQFNGVDKELLP